MCYDLKLNSSIVLLLFALLNTFSTYAMDLRNSVELETIEENLQNSVDSEIINIEEQEPKTSLLDQLKDSAIDYNLDETKELLNIVSELKSKTEKNKISLRFNYWLHKQRNSSKSFIKNAIRTHHEIILCSLAALLMGVGVFFSLNSSGLTILTLEIFGIALGITILCHIRMCYKLNKANSNEINNIEIHNTQNLALGTIAKINKVKLNPEIHNAKKIIKNSVNHAQENKKETV